MKTVLMMVMTADGIIAKDKNQNVDWSSEADKEFFTTETKKHGVVIFGDTTYLAIGRPLPGRLNLVLSMDPAKYKDKEVKGLLEFFKGSPSEVLAHLEERGYKSVVLGGGAGTNAAFLKAALVDEVLLTIEPMIFGRGLNFTEGEDLDIKMELLELKKIDTNTIQLRYKVIK